MKCYQTCRESPVVTERRHCHSPRFSPPSPPAVLPWFLIRERGQNLESIYIVSAVRTPIGKFGGSLAAMTAADLGVVAAKAALERSGVSPDNVDEAIFGNARQAGGGPNVARQIS